MKKAIIVILAVCIFFSLAMFLTFGFYDCLENQEPTLMVRKNVYPTSMIVIKVDYENDLVTIADFEGRTYQFYGCEDWYENDICAVIMNDNGTSETVYDDIILQTRYCGYVK